MTMPTPEEGAGLDDAIVARASTRDLLLHLIGRVDGALAQLTQKADRSEVEAVRQDVRELQEAQRIRVAVEAARERRETSWGRRAAWVGGVVCGGFAIAYDVVSIAASAGRAHP